MSYSLQRFTRYLNIPTGAPSVNKSLNAYRNDCTQRRAGETHKGMYQDTVTVFHWVHWWKTSFLATWVGIKATVSTLTREFTVLIYLGKLPPIIINPILILARASFCFRESREGVSQDRLLLTRLSRHTRSWELNVKYVIITSSTLLHLDIKPNHTCVDWV